MLLSLVQKRKYPKTIDKYHPYKPNSSPLSRNSWGIFHILMHFILIFFYFFFSAGEAKFLVDETSLNVTLSSILKWLTGATRIPAVGLDSKIEVLFDPTAVLPRVNTCSLQLYMPLLSKFSDPEMVMETIAEWITNSVGFGLV